MQYLSHADKKMFSHSNDRAQMTKFLRFFLLFFVFLLFTFQDGHASPFGTLNIEFKWQRHCASLSRVEAVDSKGTIYAISDEGHLVCFESNGKRLETDPIDAPIKALAIGKNDVIYLKFPRHIRCLDLRKKMLWQQVIPSSPTSSMTMGPSNLLYYGSKSGLSCFDPQDNGKIIWSYSLEKGATEIACDEAGYIYCRSAGSILCFNPEGELIWNHPCQAQSLAVTSKGEIYYYAPNPDSDGESHTLYQINLECEVNWTHTTDSPITHLATDQRGTIYIITQDRHFYSFSSDKKHLYEINLHSTIDHFSTDKRGNLYISAGNTLSCLSLAQIYDYNDILEKVHEGEKRLNSSKKNLKNHQILKAKIEEITNSICKRDHNLSFNLTHYWSEKYQKYLTPTSQPATEPQRHYTCFLSGDELYCFDANQTLCWVMNQVADLNRKAFETFGYLYITSKSGVIYRLNPETRAILWEQKQEDESFSPPTIDSQGNLYSTLSNGVIYCFSSDGEKIREFDAGADPNCSPLIDKQDYLYYYVPNESIICCRKTSMEFSWLWEMSSPLALPMTIDHRCHLYFITDQNKIVSLDHKGNEKWAYDLPFSSAAPPVISQKDHLYLITNQGELVCLDQQGNQLWMVDAGSPAITLPVVNDAGEIFFGSIGGYIWCLDSEGKPLWVYSLKGERIYLPPFKDYKGSIHFVSEEGIVYSITTPSRSRWYWPF